MNERPLEDFLLNKIDVRYFVDTLLVQQNNKQGNFILTRDHLLTLCDLALDKQITIDFLTNTCDQLMMSDYFCWNSDSTDGNIVSETLFEWANPDINYEINDLNLRLWKEYLKTGEHKLEEYNNWSSHIQQQKEICTKVGSAWRPVNPKHIIGLSGNLNDELIHGLRHAPEKGTTGWFIWTGEYSTADDFFKPMHAGHLLKSRPDLIKYLGLQPSFRFLVDQKGYEDLWQDEQLLNGCDRN